MVTVFRTFFLAMLATGGIAFAAADFPGPATPVCGKGQVYSPQQKKCVPNRNSGVDDESLYEQGRALAKLHERYEDAIAVLSLVQRQDDPRVLNFLGYSHRKLGDVEKGLVYYKRAVAIDPDYTLVREYLGEAYVQLGRLDLAREELREIEKRCGTACEPYEDLAEEIAKAEKRG